MSTSESASPPAKLVLELAEGFKKKDLDILAKPLHKDFRQITYPRSLGRPDQNKEEFLEDTARFFPLWADNKAIIHSLIEAPGKVISHATNEMKSVNGVDWAVESIIIFHIVTDEDGSLKIKTMERFLDSKTSIDIRKAFEAAGAGK